MVVVNSGLADGGNTFSIDVMYAENLFPMTLNESLTHRQIELISIRHFLFFQNPIRKPVKEKHIADSCTNC